MKTRQKIATFLIALFIALNVMNIPIKAANSNITVVFYEGTSSEMTLVDGQEGTIGNAKLKLEGNVLTVDGDLILDEKYLGVYGTFVKVTGGTLTLDIKGNLSVSSTNSSFITGDTTIVSTGNVTLTSTGNQAIFQGNIEMSLMGDLSINTNYVICREKFTLQNAQDVTIEVKDPSTNTSATAFAKGLDLSCQGKIDIDIGNYMLTGTGLNVKSDSNVNVNAGQIISGGNSSFDIQGNLDITCQKTLFSSTTISTKMEVLGHVQLYSQTGIISLGDFQLISQDCVDIASLDDNSSNQGTLFSGITSIESKGDIKINAKSYKAFVSSDVQLKSHEGSIEVVANVSSGQYGLFNNSASSSNQVKINANKNITLKNGTGMICASVQMDIECLGDINIEGNSTNGNAILNASNNSVSIKNQGKLNIVNNSQKRIFTGKELNIDTKDNVVLEGDFPGQLLIGSLIVQTPKDVQLINKTGMVLTFNSQIDVLTINQANDVYISGGDMMPALQLKQSLTANIQGNLTIESKHIAIFEGDINITHAKKVKITGDSTKFPTHAVINTTKAPVFNVEGSITVTNQSTSGKAFNYEPTIGLSRYVVFAGTATSENKIDSPSAATYTGNSHVRILPIAPTPEWTYTTTASTITVDSDYDEETYGKLEYKIDNGQWAELTHFNNLHSVSLHEISVRSVGNNDFYMSDENIKNVTTSPTQYTVTIPMTQLSAGGNEQGTISIDTEQAFDLGYLGKIHVKAKVDKVLSNDGKLTLTHTKDSNATISSYLLVNGQRFQDLTKDIVIFKNKSDSSVSICFSKPEETFIPAGTYEGQMTFDISYDEY